MAMKVLVGRPIVAAAAFRGGSPTDHMAQVSEAAKNCSAGRTAGVLAVHRSFQQPLQLRAAQSGLLNTYRFRTQRPQQIPDDRLGVPLRLIEDAHIERALLHGCNRGEARLAF